MGLLSILDPEPVQGHMRAPRSRRRRSRSSRQALDGLLENSAPSRCPAAERHWRSARASVIRVLNEMYESALAWNLEVTGLASLNLERLY